MGCLEGRDACCPEEQRQRESERYLGFESFSCQSLDFFIRKLCSKDKMNKNQFKQMIVKLDSARNGPSKQSSVLLFLNILLNFRGKYDRTLLLLLVVLYGEAKAEERVQTLFDIFDPEISGCIPLDDVRKVSNTLVDISIDKAFLLIRDESLSKQESAALVDYKKRLNKYRLAVVEEIEKVMIGRDKWGNCYIRTLLESVKDHKKARLFTARGIRERAFELSVGRSNRKKQRSVTLPQETRSTDNSFT